MPTTQPLQFWTGHHIWRQPCHGQGRELLLPVQGTHSAKEAEERSGSLPHWASLGRLFSHFSFIFLTFPLPPNQELDKSLTSCWLQLLWTLRNSESVCLLWYVAMSAPLSHLYSVDGKYVPQGKIGCAVLGLHSAKDVNTSCTSSSLPHVFLTLSTVQATALRDTEQSRHFC